MNAEEIWGQYENMFHDIAHKLSGANSPHHDDMVQEAFLKVLEKLPEYDSARAKLSTWVFQTARYQMIEFIRKEKRMGPAINTQEATGEDEKGGAAVPARDSWLERFLLELSDEGKALVGAFLEAPEELAAVAWGRKAEATRAVESYMIDAKDWNKASFWRSYNEIQGAL